MKLIILTSAPSGRVAQRFFDAALKAGLSDVRIVGTNDAKALLNEALEDAVILPRIAPEQNHAVSILETLETKGAQVVNSFESWIDSRDKLRTYQQLSRSGVPTPYTVAAPRGIYAPDEILGSKVIFKPLNGTHGDGIIFVEPGDMLPSEPGILQTFVPEAENSDVRLFVVGDEVVAAMKRTAKIGDFRANLHQGASAEVYTPTDAMKQRALAASRALGLEIAGVDMLPTDDGGLVIEANPSPGLGIEAYTGSDVAGAVIAYCKALFKPTS